MQRTIQISTPAHNGLYDISRQVEQWSVKVLYRVDCARCMHSAILGIMTELFLSNSYYFC